MTDPSTYADESDQPGLEWRARRRAACFGRRDKDGDDKVQNLPKSQTPSPSAYGSRRIYFDGEGRQATPVKPSAPVDSVLSLEARLPEDQLQGRPEKRRKSSTPEQKETDRTDPGISDPSRTRAMVDADKHSNIITGRDKHQKIDAVENRDRGETQLREIGGAYERCPINERMAEEEEGRGRGETRLATVQPSIRGDNIPRLAPPRYTDPVTGRDGRSFGRFFIRDDLYHEKEWLFHKATGHLVVPVEGSLTEFPFFNYAFKPHRDSLKDDVLFKLPIRSGCS